MDPQQRPYALQRAPLGLPLAHPVHQTVFPIRPPLPYIPHNEAFVRLCFLHLPDGGRLRMILLRFLRSDWWLLQQSTPDGELNWFGAMRSQECYECRFCANLYGTYEQVEDCIMAHINYHP